MPAPKCIRCESPMDPGFLVDFRHGNIAVQRWCEGEPESSFWSGEVKLTQANEGLKVFSYRCPECGLLESYAVSKG